MNIRSRSDIHEAAGRALDRAPNTRQIVLFYTAVCCGLSLAVTVLSALFSDRISGTGGLSNIGLRSILSTGQSVLPLAQAIVTACLGLGYHIAILTITRGYEASPRTLLQGFHHFGALIRAILLQGFLYFGIAFTCMYISAFLFLMTPFSQEFTALMEPLIASMSILDAGLVLDEATLMAAAETIVPMIWIFAGVFLLLFVPMYYGFRMVTFCLAEDPRRGAMAAMSKSFRLMKRNRFALFRLDLSMWWFYLGQAIIMLLCYGDVLLSMMGITLPWSDTVSFYGFYLLSMAVEILLYYFAMNRVSAVYAVAYDALQDQLPKPNFPVQM